MCLPVCFSVSTSVSFMAIQCLFACVVNSCLFHASTSVSLCVNQCLFPVPPSVSSCVLSYSAPCMCHQDLSLHCVNQCLSVVSTSVSLLCHPVSIHVCLQLDCLYRVRRSVPLLCQTPALLSCATYCIFHVSTSASIISPGVSSCVNLQIRSRCSQLLESILKDILFYYSDSKLLLR